MAHLALEGESRTKGSKVSIDKSAASGGVSESLGCQLIVFMAPELDADNPMNGICFGDTNSFPCSAVMR